VGIEHLSSLPRGTGEYSFYTEKSQYVPIKSIQLGDQLEKDQQIDLEILRTDTQTFRRYVTSRTSRLDDWFADPSGRIGLCNISVPSRETERQAAAD
jgi:peptidylprolyl isomerase